jgi:hypothetical protein
MSATAPSRSSPWMRNPLFFSAQLEPGGSGRLHERGAVFRDEVQLGPACAMRERRDTDQVDARIAQGGQDTRALAGLTHNLAQAIRTFGEQLTADQAGARPPRFQVSVEGSSRDLAPLVCDEISRLAGEALRNSFKHAQARRIDVEIHYEKRWFRLRVRDDGKGIDPQVLDELRRAGHYGLPGMEERARLVDGKLAVWSDLNSGTDIELTIPASIAYVKSPPAQPSMSAGKETSR